MPISHHNKVIENQSISVYISPNKSIETNDAPN
jgi:hypothetical protein